MTPGLSAFKLAFELSPIILVGGAADAIPFKMLPIMAITEVINLPLGLLGAGGNKGLDDFFAHYTPVAGASMIDQDVATYPFANSTVAANSTMSKPLTVSFQMIVPAKGPAGYFTKLPIMMMLQRTLEKHNASGGTYTLLTPSFIYTNCLMIGMRDVSTSATHQVQNTWQFDFVKPLITVSDAQGAMNGLMERLSSGSPIQGQPLTTGLQSGLGTGLPATGVDVVPSMGSPASIGVPTGPGSAVHNAFYAPTIPTTPQGPLGGGGV